MAFTLDAAPAAEAHVAEDLSRIVEAVRAEASGDALLAVYLLGGYARGEGTVVSASDGVLHGFNDYDLLLVFDSPPAHRERFAALSRRLALEIGIDFVDLGLATPKDLAAAPPTLFWYELGEAHRMLWSREGAEVALPRFRAEELDPAEGSRLLLNRGMALLWAGARLWPGSAPGEGTAAEAPEELRFATIAAHKAVLAAGDAALLRAGAYVPAQAARATTIASRPELTAWAPPDFADAYARGVSFRRSPQVGDSAATATLWWAAREHHERGFRAAEEARLGEALADWSGYAEAIAAARPGGLRAAARRLRRGVRGGRREPDESRWMTAMTGLLYRPPASTPEIWNERALALVREWHP